MPASSTNPWIELSRVLATQVLDSTRACFAVPDGSLLGGTGGCEAWVMLHFKRAAALLHEASGRSSAPKLQLCTKHLQVRELMSHIEAADSCACAD
jgi:hypothetical protein